MRYCLFVSVCSAVVAIISSPVLALDATNPIRFSPLAGWQGFELVTQNDDISLIADAGYGGLATRGIYDGLGAYRADGNLLITVNHEQDPDGAISGLTLELAAFQQALQSTIDGGVTPMPAQFVDRMGFAYDSIYDGSYHAKTGPNPVATGTLGVAAYGQQNFRRFCSGTTHRANTFGLDRGFVDPIYITGEEVAGGHFYALDVRTSTLWEAPDLGLGYWENAAAIDTGNSTHLAMLLMSDLGSGSGDYLQLYVGEKNVDANADGQIDFLERNGLRGGTVHYFAPDAGFSLTDLPDGTVTGEWQESRLGALRETKLEDAHTDPANGSRLVFADQTDGVYIMDTELIFDRQGINLDATTVTITQIDDDDVQPIGAPDNLVWSANGMLYVQEDGDGNGMFEMASTGGSITQIANAFSEPSGIVDVSALVGYQPGSVLLSSLQGNGSSGAQLSALVSPSAMRIPRPGDFNSDEAYNCADVDALVAEIAAGAHDPPFDLTSDGLVDHNDLVAWLAAAGAANLASGGSYLLGDANLDGTVQELDFSAWNEHRFTATAAWCSGDFNADGTVDGQDFVLWNSNKFTSAARPVPEPATWLIGMVSVLVLGIRERSTPSR